MKIGVLGAGQLGRMLALAGIPLGHSFRFFDPTPEPPASDIAEHVCAHYTDHEALKRFAAGLDLVTFEFENVSSEAVAFLSDLVPVRPGIQALQVTQERFSEKDCFSSLGIPTAPYVKLSENFSETERWTRLCELGFPFILKTRRFGYDGKGQMVVRDASSAKEVHAFCEGKDILAESLQPFTRELSLLLVRSLDGVARYYPLVENVHREGILRSSRCPPAFLPHTYQGDAESYGLRIAEHLQYVGVIAIEFFDVDGKLVANEMAPRVHNSGHWTIEGAVCSQFENHVRAITGAPLGVTSLIGWSLMANLIGYEPNMQQVLAVPGAHLHWYGKVPRPGRKVGHATLVLKTEEEREKRAPELLRACADPLR